MYKLTSVIVLYNFAFMLLIAQPEVIKLWPNGVPNSIADPAYKEQVVQTWGKSCWAKVTDPELLIYRPAKEKATGTAIIICPGGGYQVISFTNEGNDIVAWLNSEGITAIILKYRLPSDSIMKDKTIGPLQDAQEAVRVVRRNASKLNIDPSKIGIMGFSAGGHLAATLSTRFGEETYAITDSISARPDFAVLGYPVISMFLAKTHVGSRINLLGQDPDSAMLIKFSNDLHVSSNTPPTFIFHSTDDGTVPVENTLNYFEALQKQKVPVEMHIYPSGGHGYGLAMNGKSEAGWPAACMNWLKANGW